MSLTTMNVKRKGRSKGTNLMHQNGLHHHARIRILHISFIKKKEEERKKKFLLNLA